MSKFKQYEGSNTITLSSSTNLENEYIKDENGNYIYLGFTDGTTYDNLINNFNQKLVDTKETLYGVSLNDTSLCSWTIDENDNSNTAKRMQITIKNPLKIPKRIFNLRYNKVTLLNITNIYFDPNRTITVKLWYDERLVDQTNDTYDVINGVSSITLNEALPYKLNFTINVKFRDNPNDEWNGRIANCYFEANSTNAIINEDSLSPLSVIANYYDFDYIQFYDNGNYKLGETEDMENNILKQVTLDDGYIISVHSTNH